MLATFALGTAAGDLTAIALNLGFLASILLFAGADRDPGDRLVAVQLNPIVAFWFAYMVTRPLGASFADWFSKPARAGWARRRHRELRSELVVFMALVAYVAITKCEFSPPAGRREPSHQDARLPRLAVEPE